MCGYELYARNVAAGLAAVRRGSRTPGIDGVSVDLFASIAGEQLAGLHRQLVAETYLPAPAKGFFLPKASGGKRLLGIPTVRDRVVQRLHKKKPGFFSTFN